MSALPGVVLVGPSWRAIHPARARAWQALPAAEQARRIRECPSLAATPEQLVPCPVHAGCGAIVGEPCDVGGDRGR